ncbi:MAG: hypothetical protein P8182_15680 [Deltaproteobacteria bacterium]|jgi:hypothetical protein
MKRLKTLACIVGTSCLLLGLLVSPGVCWNLPTFPTPPIGVGPPVPLAPPGFPSCPPQRCGSACSIEGGGRAFYTTNTAKIFDDLAPDIDFIEDLHFSQNTLVGEVYAALRVPPWLALTYTFLLPREDHGYGFLPADFVLGDVFFPAGTQVAAKSITSLHRWEAEYFFGLRCDCRAGPLLMAELLVDTLQMDARNDNGFLVGAKETFSEFLLGIGGTAEFAPSQNVFFRGKAAYTFLQDQGGFFLDLGARYFCDVKAGCGPPSMFSDIRPYLGVGYRYRTSTWYHGDRKFLGTIHGPYASVGVVF